MVPPIDRVTSEQQQKLFEGLGRLKFEKPSLVSLYIPFGDSIKKWRKILMKENEIEIKETIKSLLNLLLKYRSASVPTNGLVIYCHDNQVVMFEPVTNYGIEPVYQKSNLFNVKIIEQSEDKE